MNKKILLTSANLFPPRGGAERSAFALAQRLAKDFEVTILTPHDKDIIKKEKGYTLIAVKRPFYIEFGYSFLKINMQNSWWHKVLKEILKKEKYDLIMTHGILIPSFYNLKTSAKKVIFVRGLSLFPDYDPVKNLFFKILYFVQKPLIKNFQSEGLKAIGEAEVVISNSKFIQAKTKKHTQRDSEVIYPPIDPKKFKSEKTKKSYILFVNPNPDKGVEIMYKIAKNCKDRKFLVVGKNERENRKYSTLLKNLKNVEHINYLDDMRKAYDKTRLLVSPVIWDEPFGRTPAEAMVNGIPSIVSDRGGLPEVVGNSGDIIKEINNVKEWVKNIKKYDVEKYYKKKSELCVKRVKKFYLNSQYKKLHKILLSVLMNHHS